MKVAETLRCTLCGNPLQVYADDTARMVRVGGVPMLVCLNCEALIAGHDE